MSNEVGRGVTVREMWRLARTKLEPRHFISTMDLFLVPKVPSYLMDPGRARVAKKALDLCTKTVGLWGERASQYNTQRFEVAARVFERSTEGVSAKTVIELAREELLNRHG